MFKDKNQAVKHPADILPKKVGETLPPQSSQMGYGIYHFCECEYSRRWFNKNRMKQTEQQQQQKRFFGMHTRFFCFSFHLFWLSIDSLTIFQNYTFFKIQKNHFKIT